MTSPLSSYLSARCESRVKPGGQRGVFARAPLAKGELIAIFGGWPAPMG
jgi:hypothetical protein